ncbi:MAG: KH domain-containing protein [Erysipelotrichaceae bacterium]
MMNYEQVLLDLVTPMAEDKASLSVKKMPSLDEKEILLYVYANSEDVARLIGKKGSMSASIRQMMSIASRNENKKITIKFESY